MFKKQQRVSSTEFDYYFKHGQRMHSPIGQYIHHPNESLKVAVVVPKKVIKTAVGRNRLRRQTYHVLREYLKNKTGVHIFIFSKGVLNVGTTERNQILSEVVGGNTKAR